MKLVTRYLPNLTGIIKGHVERKISVLEPSLSLMNNQTLYYMQMKCAITGRNYINKYTNVYSFQQQPKKPRIKKLNNSGFSLNEVQDRYLL